MTNPRAPGPVRMRFGAAVTVAVAVGATWLLAPPGIFTAPAKAATGVESRMAAEIAAQINSERSARGLAHLSVSATLGSQAQAIAESNRDQTCHACHSSSVGNGEVVQWSGGPGASGRSTVAWMLSTTHRDILMSPDLTAIGVGLACYPDGGQEAVGRVTGPVTTGSPTSPVVTSSRSGSDCGSASTTTNAPPPVSTTPSTTGGSSGSKSSDGGNGAAPPAAGATPHVAAVTTTTTRRSNSPPSTHRSPTTAVTSPAAGADATPADAFSGADNIVAPPASTTSTSPRGDRAAASGDPSSLAAAAAAGGAPKPRTTGALVVGMGLVATCGVALWRTRESWLARGQRR